MNQLKTEVENAEFLGLSHTRCRKTTLTEKLLLHGGAFARQGTVKARKNSKHAKSDWMEIEKQRGISVTSWSCNSSIRKCGFDYGLRQGHNDFGEDTYRVLTSSIARSWSSMRQKGLRRSRKKLSKFAECAESDLYVHEQTRPSGERPARAHEELEEVLGMPSVAVTWPIGSGMQFEGVYDRIKNEVHLFRGDKSVVTLNEEGVNDPILASHLTEENLTNLRDEIDC